jgi:hypothetical protein
MTTAILFKPDVWAPFRQLLQWLMPSVHSAPSASTAPTPSRQTTPVLIAGRAVSIKAKTQLEPQNKPLRIVRILESDQPRAAVGRMVISGRMADVCAELDRLAACEAA